MQIKEHCMQSNCNVNLKLVLIVLSLISSISSLYLPIKYGSYSTKFQQVCLCRKESCAAEFLEGIISH